MFSKSTYSAQYLELHQCNVMIYSHSGFNFFGITLVLFKKTLSFLWIQLHRKCALINHEYTACPPFSYFMRIDHLQYNDKTIIKVILRVTFTFELGPKKNVTLISVIWPIKCSYLREGLKHWVVLNALWPKFNRYKSQNNENKILFYCKKQFAWCIEHNIPSLNYAYSFIFFLEDKWCIFKIIISHHSTILILHGKCWCWLELISHNPDFSFV